MLDQEDLKWIATASTELNSMLQQIARYSDLARQHKGENDYVEELGERVEMASKKSQAMFDRVTNSILANATNKPSPGGKGKPVRSFSVVPASPVAPAPGNVSLRPPPEPAQNSSLNASPTEQPDAVSDIPVLNPEGPGELILLVDDETEISTIASMILCDEGYKVILAKEGFEALRIYRQIGTKIGLVILDFFLPVMDGDVVFDELRLINPNINVVLSSGFAEQSKIGAMLAQGLRGFIPKPYTREKLLQQVRSTLEAARHEMN